MGANFGKNGGSKQDQETLKHLKYNPATNQIESDREIQTTLNSFFLGDQHKMSSGAENIFFTNLNSKTNFFPAWSGLKDHRIVGNRGAGGVITPSIRKYADMQTLEPYGAAAASGSVAYNKAAALLGNHSVLGQTFIVMETVAADDWLEYQVWYGTDETGIQAYEQKFTGQAYAIGATVDWWFTHPIEGFTGTPIVTCIKLHKGGEDGEAHYLQVRPSASNAANHYSAVRLRVFNDAHIHVPRIGDIKESFQPSDHEGWFLLNGRAKSSLSTTVQAAATSLGWGTSIPDARNRVSVGAGSTYGLGTTGGSVTIGRASLPNFTLTGFTDDTNTDHTHSGTTLTARQVNTDHSHGVGSLGMDLGGAHYHYRYGRTGSNNVWLDGGDDRTGTYDLHSFGMGYDSGDGDHAHTLKGNTGTALSNTQHQHPIDGNTGAMLSNVQHKHPYTTTSINGGVTQQAHMVPYLAVNKFVYLGY